MCDVLFKTEIVLQRLVIDRNYNTSIFAVDNILIYAGDRKCITVTDISTSHPKKLNSLIGHTNSITSLYVIPGYILSGSLDNTVILWNMYNGSCINTFTGHTDKISSLFIHNNLIISGSYDKTIRIWCINTFKYIKELKPDTFEVTSLFAIDNFILSGSVNGNIYVWDIEEILRPKNSIYTKKITEIDIFEGHYATVLSIFANKDIMVSSSMDKTIRIWDFKVGEGICKHIITNDHSVRINVFSDIIFSTSYNTIKLWNLYTYEPMAIIKNMHKCQIYSSFVIKDKLITASADGIIKITKYVTPKQYDHITKLLRSYEVPMQVIMDVLNYIDLNDTIFK